jgi:2-polyprenyl-3-methyl-5-hydroxy-6-metoxy-1,4-benzoquinol methylase
MNTIDYKKSWGQINAQRLAAILHEAGDDIFDVGCATGDYVHYLNQHGYHAKGCDIKEYPEWNEKDFLVADANCLSLPSNNVDTIICFEVLEHLQKPLNALAAMHRACRKNLILSVPNCSHYPALSDSGLNFNHYIDRSHCNFWTPDEISKLVIEAGFTIAKLELINQIHPESLFFANLKLPRRISCCAGYCYDHLPWVKRYYMTSLVVANKRI